MTYTDSKGNVHIVDTWEELCYLEHRDAMEEWGNTDKSDIEYIWDMLD